MDNVKKCEKIGILADVRQRLGADSEVDNSVDNKINGLTNHEIIAAWCGWHLGDKSWWEEMKKKFDWLESNN